MSSKGLGKQQLSLTAFFTDSSRKGKGRSSNTEAPMKRKRAEVEVVGKEPEPTRKQTSRSSIGAGVGAKPVIDKSTARKPGRKPSYQSVGNATSDLEDTIDLTLEADEPLMTPLPVVKERRPADRLLHGHRKPQLMTPPSSSAIKRTNSQTGNDPAQNARHALSFSTPGFGLTPKTIAKAKGEPQASSSKVPQRQSIVTGRNARLGLQTPGASEPRAKRPRLHSNVISTTVALPSRDSSSAEIDSPTTSPIVPSNQLPALEEDVFASASILTPSTPRTKRPIHGSPGMKKSVPEHIFKAPALPIYTHDSRFSNSDESLVATSQTQDLRPYIPTPPRPRATRPVGIPISPEAARLAHEGTENLTPRRFTGNHDEDLVGTSQSQEVEMRLPESWLPTKAEEFVLSKNHLLRTPVKSKPLLQSAKYSYFNTPIRTPGASTAAFISPSQHFSSPIRPMHSQFYDIGGTFENHAKTSPAVSTHRTPSKRSLHLFETQTLSPNIPRSFEDWRITGGNLILDSDSATEPESDDFAAVLQQAPDDVVNSPSQRKAPKNTVLLAGEPLVPMGNPSQIDIPVVAGEIELPSSLPTADSYEDDDEGSRSRTPTPLREFLNMVGGDGSYPDDFPQSWRD